MSATDQVNKLLAECGATLKREKNHEIWSLPNGKTFTRAKTPSDQNEDRNNLTDLKRALGITKTVATVGERRPKVVKNVTERPIKYDKPVNGSLASQLKDAGISDEAIRDRMSALETRISTLELTASMNEEIREGLRERILEIGDGIAALEKHVNECWACRLWKWLQLIGRK